ncbi:MAG: ATPase P [Chloroflexi bacterium]|nr:ATPase P [Chloroflexota bacterium]
MIQIDVPGDKVYQLEHLVLDYNGTLACDGRLLPGVGQRLVALAKHLKVHVLTADTFGTAGNELAGIPGHLTTLPPGDQAAGKQAVVQALGADRVVAVGNGRNDQLMLVTAVLGIAVVQEEGAAAATLMAADVVAPSIAAALDLLLWPLRLTATLRV